MNNLWIFGDSFSAPFNSLARWKWFKDYLAFLEKDRISTWQELLAEKLDLNLVELGETAICNSEIFDRFATNCSKIKEKDTVILNWTRPERFRVPEEGANKFLNLVPGALKHTDHEDRFFSFEEIQKIGVSRMHNLYQIEINNWANLINEFCKLKDVRTVYWGLTDTQPYYDFDIPLGEQIKYKIRILDHQVENQDYHFSIYGHEYVANKIADILINYKKKPTELFTKRLV